MKFNKWTVALAATGVVSLASAVQADESHPVNTALSSTTLSGYVDTSAIWNFGTGHTVANRFANTGSDRQDGFNVNTINLLLEKPIDEGTWSAGYKFETMFGPDANVMPGALTSGVAIKQAHAVLRAPIGNGIDFKIGQFDPIVGYEVTESYKNPNFSRSFGFNNLEPFGHTGILASYQVNDIIGVSGGVANGDSGFGLNGGSLTASGFASGQVGSSMRGMLAESSKVYMGSVVVKAPESAGWLSGSSLYVLYVGAVNGDAKGSKNDPTLLYVGVSLATPIKELSLGASADLLFNGGGTGARGNSYANAYAFYTGYQITEKLKANNRFEYATSGYGAFLPGRTEDKVIGETFTLDYALWSNVLTRGEFRWDRSVDGGANPFDGQKNDLSLTASIVYKF
ncbi:MAG: outer membrane beta-barrel protein [Verrucomicrobia bacterium]|nr:outer membrane beta-barrel protein [Verrucomicrobiota bacterium]